MVVAAMGVNMGEDGHCGEQVRAYHERQARGGAGLIVLGVTSVAWPVGANQPRQLAISHNRFIPGLRALADAVHRHGAKVAAQIHHGGLVAVQDSAEGRPLWVPSYPVARQGNLYQGFLEEELARFANPDAPRPKLHVMTGDDIDKLVQWYADAARRARAADLDGVEIHAGHGYIISSFLSPQSNQRDDEYGGSLENRARLLLRIIEAVRTVVGRAFPVWCKLDAGEYGVAEGISLADARRTAQLVEAAGVDAIAVTAYHDTSRGALHSESNIPHTPERMVSDASAIRAAVSIPVIASGRIEPAAADKHIARGHFDFLAMGRKILADPDLPAKVTASTPEQIRPCIYCYCCVSQIYLQNTVKCAVNPETASERERWLIASDRPRHIAVVGGGPAGMEVARRLQLRGFRVTLIERGERLGGTLQFASVAYPANTRLLEWLRLQVETSAATILLNTEADPDLLHRLGVSEVVVAIGARRTLPDIPGCDRDFVLSGDDMRALVMAEESVELERKTSAFARLLTRLAKGSGLSGRPAWLRLAARIWMPLGKRVVIIGSGVVGLELAEFLAERGRAVSVIDSAARPGSGLYLVRRLRLLEELEHLGVTLLNSATDIAIEEQLVSYTNCRGQRRSLDVDHVIVASGASTDTQLAASLQADGFRAHSVGDCRAIGYIEGAMESAAQLAARV